MISPLQYFSLRALIFMQVCVRACACAFVCRYEEYMRERSMTGIKYSFYLTLL